MDPTWTDSGSSGLGWTWEEPLVDIPSYQSIMLIFAESKLKIVRENENY